jgi:hypothetical protein
MAPNGINLCGRNGIQKDKSQRAEAVPDSKYRQIGERENPAGKREIER